MLRGRECGPRATISHAGRAPDSALAKPADAGAGA
jgi:hypothetical protein